MIRFQIVRRLGRARTGLLETPHGTVETPVFMPVGTRAAVKALAPAQLEAAGVRMLLSNAYHLTLKPGDELVAKMGGLHAFMGWKRPILTDSGGYQVFSLARLRKVSDEGVEFQSHIDGATVGLTPERVIEIQQRLGSDVIMPLDEPAPWPCDEARAEAAMRRTHAWLERSIRPIEGQSLFGIVQGGVSPRLRKASVEAVCAHGLDGYAIGGLSLGEPAEVLYGIAGETAALMPDDRPRYLMGVGTPADLARAVALGVDMFDCVLPTRLGRNGWAFTSEGMIKIRNAEWKEDGRPVDPKCDCPCCSTFSRAYLRHCFNVDEILGLSMLSLHNIRYYVDLMRRLREAIVDGTLDAVAAEEARRCPPLAGRREPTES